MSMAIVYIHTSPYLVDVNGVSPVMPRVSILLVHNFLVLRYGRGPVYTSDRTGTAYTDHNNARCSNVIGYIRQVSFKYGRGLHFSAFSFIRWPTMKIAKIATTLPIPAFRSQ